MLHTHSAQHASAARFRSIPAAHLVEISPSCSKVHLLSPVSVIPMCAVFPIQRLNGKYIAHAYIHLYACHVQRRPCLLHAHQGTERNRGRVARRAGLSAEHGRTGVRCHARGAPLTGRADQLIELRPAGELPSWARCRAGSYSGGGSGGSAAAVAETAAARRWRSKRRHQRRHHDIGCHHIS